MILTYGLIAVGLALSVLSHYGVCSLAGCSRLHGVEIFFLPMELWGILFFVLLAVLVLLNRSVRAGAVRTALLTGALGAEITLVTIQWTLKDLCPMCLGVTGVVLLLWILELSDMRAVLRSLRSAPSGLAGRRWAAARPYLGVAGLIMGLLLSQPVKGEFITTNPATETETIAAAQADPVPGIGKTGRYPVVRIYSDYFCPMCRRHEPVINKVIGDVSDRARIMFFDLPTHGVNSKRYIAFFIASLLGGNDPDRILDARASLFDLAGEKVNDSSRLQSLLQARGIRLLLDGPTINGYFGAARESAVRDGVTSTPTVVVEKEAGEKQVFKGPFTREQVLEALGMDPKA
jgi:hypothetical protein